MRLRLTIFALSTLLGCGGSSPVEPSFDPLLLDASFQRARQIPNITSVVVAQGGEVLREEYLNGGGPDTAQDIRSVTKSILALTIGIAFERGCLTSLDQTLGELIGPQVAAMEPDKATISIRHLLTMSGGFEWTELPRGPDFGLWINAPNQIDFVLARPLLDPPGTRFRYSSGAIHLLSVILTEACGVDTAGFAETHLFAPLGITGGREWPLDNQGYNNGGAGLSLTPHDMLSVGNMVLQRGRSGGGQVVSSAWMEAATRFQIATGDPIPYGSGYGYGFWVGSSEVGEVTFAMGWGGQFIVVAPEVRVVVVTTARWWGIGIAAGEQQWAEIIDLIMTDILSAFG